ncbi:MAG: YgfZ/GcvT domain-containing protein [Bacteroidota bacterium]
MLISNDIDVHSLPWTQLNIPFDVVEMVGPESLEFLHRITSNDLSTLPDGTIQHTLLVSDKGRIIDTAWVINRNNTILLVLSKGMAVEVMAWLNKYIIMEDIQLNNVSDRFTITIHSDSNAPLYRTQFFGIPVSFELHESTIDKLHEDSRLYECWRIENGIPASRHEMVQDYNPLELNLWNWISFTKGCYIGQEVIARLDTYNKIQRVLVLISSHQKLDEQQIITDQSGVDVGKITSVFHQETRSIGLALLRVQSAVSGTTLNVKGNDFLIHVDKVFRKQ